MIHLLSSYDNNARLTNNQSRLTNLVGDGFMIDYKSFSIANFRACVCVCFFSLLLLNGEFESVWLNHLNIKAMTWLKSGGGRRSIRMTGRSIKRARKSNWVDRAFWHRRPITIDLRSRAASPPVRRGPCGLVKLLINPSFFITNSSPAEESYCNVLPSYWGATDCCPHYSQSDK